MRFFHHIASFFRKVSSFIGIEDFSQAAEYAIKIAQELKTLSPTAGKKRDEIITIYKAYELPLSKALQDGKITQEEAKMLIGRAAALILQKRFPELSTTQSNILANSAYLEIK
jgi:hypothetical protein